MILLDFKELERVQLSPAKLYKYLLGKNRENTDITQFVSDKSYLREVIRANASIHSFIDEALWYNDCEFWAGKPEFRFGYLKELSNAAEFIFLISKQGRVKDVLALDKSSVYSENQIYGLTNYSNSFLSLVSNRKNWTPENVKDSEINSSLYTKVKCNLNAKEVIYLGSSQRTMYENTERDHVYCDQFSSSIDSKLIFCSPLRKMSFYIPLSNILDESEEFSFTDTKYMRIFMPEKFAIDNVNFSFRLTENAGLHKTNTIEGKICIDLHAYAVKSIKIERIETDSLK